MDDSSLYVAALGASTPLGRDAWSSAAAIRAGISAFGEHPYVIDSAGEPMRVACAPWLDVECHGQPRMEALLCPAIEQALEPIAAIADPTIRVALALGLPSPRPGLPGDLERELRLAVVNRFRNRFAAVGTFASGHASTLLALSAACQKTRDRAFDAFVVAGVESYLAPETLEWLEASEQLHGTGTLNNAWGFIPGEGAGAALLVRGDVLARIGVAPLARVLSVGTGYERNLIKTETVCIGEGLTTAFRAALAGLPAGEQVTDVFCDMNGEPYRADEFGFAYLRTKDAFVSASDFVAPADCWGDVSAATMPLTIALSTIAGRKAYAKGCYAFLWCSSESGERGAALLELPRSQG